MNKQEFFDCLQQGLSALPQEEIEERLSFYNEMINDRMEEGLTEEQAVAAVGTVESVIAQTVVEVPVSVLQENNAGKKSQDKLFWVLLIIGAPLWLSLGVTVFAVAVSLYTAILLSAWAVFISVSVSGVACALQGAVLLFGQHWLTGIAVLGTAAFCFGGSVFLFVGCKWVTKVISKWMKNGMQWIWRSVRKKEAAK